KRTVVAEQLERLAGIQWDGVVERVDPVLGHRTRMRYAVTPEGAVGLRGWRSHEGVALPPEGCLIAAPGPSLPELERLAAGASVLEVAVGDAAAAVLADGRVVLGPGVLRQHTS